MEFDAVIVKDSPGLCRCCLAEGCYKELGAPYFCGGHTEVYGDMLMECFDICISQQSDGPNGPSRHICEVCIGRLRDAAEFKRQVLESEKTFVDMIGRKDFTRKLMFGKNEMKKEPNTDLDDDGDDDTMMIDAGDGFDDDTDEEPLVSLKSRSTRAAPARPPRGLHTDRKRKIKKNEGGKRAVGTRRRRILQILFNNTSVVPFKWRAKYHCFYCNIVVNQYEALREHTEAHGKCSIEDIAAACKNRTNRYDVRIDISDIKCKICKDKFENLNDIVDHLNDEHDLDVDIKDILIAGYRLADLSCYLCPKKFEYAKEYIAHMFKSHPIACYECKKCNENFQRKRDLAAHMTQRHKEEVYKCKFCSHECATRSSLRHHVAKEHATNKCDKCTSKFSSPVLLEKHIKNKHSGNSPEPRPAVKEKIKKEYVNSSYLKTREKSLRVKESILAVIKTSTATPFSYYKNKFKCFYCPESYIDPATLRDHTDSHVVSGHETKFFQKCGNLASMSVKIDIKDLKCRSCQESLTDLAHLIKHLTVIHDIAIEEDLKTYVEPYKLVKDEIECPECPGRIFKYFNILVRHVNAIHTNNNIVCALCGLTFAKEKLLKVHLRNKHKPDKYTCYICEEECVIRARLDVHMAKVHGIKITRCLKCGERFETAYLKQKHDVEVHKTGYKCPQCPREFHRNSYVEAHVRRVHLKEKTVPCSVCGLKFFNMINLRRHMIKHTGEKNYHCDVCGVSFMYRKSLVKHLARHSSVTDVPNAME